MDECFEYVDVMAQKLFVAVGTALPWYVTVVTHFQGTTVNMYSGCSQTRMQCAIVNITF